MADIFAVEGGDAVAYGVEHALDLVIAAFEDGDAGCFFSDDLEHGRQSGDVFVGKVDAVPEPFGGIGCDWFSGGDEVGFSCLRSRFGELARPLAVVGKDEEPGAGAIEPAGDVEFVVLVLWVDQFHYCGMLGVGGGAKVAGGFVEHQVGRRRVAEKCVV